MASRSGIMTPAPATSRGSICWLLAAALAASAAAASVRAQDDDLELVHLTLDEALAEAFPQADSLWTETWTPAAAERAALERLLGWRLEEAAFVFHRAARMPAGGGRTSHHREDLGWAVVTEQIGHHRPITFLVHVKPDGDVGSVHVMVYRESRGGEIRRERFLRQYRGKNRDSPLRLNRDIVGISGATLSVRAANASVRRVLALVAARYGAGKDG
ncbi:MAG: FMN-binding protein [Candidatus Krumholzibacteriia bacterium]